MMNDMTNRSVARSELEKLLLHVFAEDNIE